MKITSLKMQEMLTEFQEQVLKISTILNHHNWLTHVVRVQFNNIKTSDLLINTYVIIVGTNLQQVISQIIKKISFITTKF